MCMHILPVTAVHLLYVRLVCWNVLALAPKTTHDGPPCDMAWHGMEWYGLVWCGGCLWVRHCSQLTPEVALTHLLQLLVLVLLLLELLLLVLLLVLLIVLLFCGYYIMRGSAAVKLRCVSLALCSPSTSEVITLIALF